MNSVVEVTSKGIHEEVGLSVFGKEGRRHRRQMIFVIASFYEAVINF